MRKKFKKSKKTLKKGIDLFEKIYYNINTLVGKNGTKCGEVSRI